MAADLQTSAPSGAYFIDKRDAILEVHPGVTLCPPFQCPQMRVVAIGVPHRIRFVEVQRLGADGFEELGKFGTALSGFEDE